MTSISKIFEDDFVFKKRDTVENDGKPEPDRGEAESDIIQVGEGYVEVQIVIRDKRIDLSDLLKQDETHPTKKYEPLISAIRRALGSLPTARRSSRDSLKLLVPKDAFDGGAT